MVKQTISALILFVFVMFEPAFAAPRFKIEAGKFYLFVFECLPQVGCYSEVVHVVAYDKKARRVLGADGFWFNLERVSQTKEVVPQEGTTPPAPPDNSRQRIAWKTQLHEMSSNR